MMSVEQAGDQNDNRSAARFRTAWLASGILADALNRHAPSGMALEQRGRNVKHSICTGSQATP